MSLGLPGQIEEAAAIRAAMKGDHMGPTLFWQITRGCDLGCHDCLVAAEGSRHGVEELSTYEAYKTIDQIAALQPGRLVITGGDPLRRNDFFQLVDYAHRRGLSPAVTVSPTRTLTPESIEGLRRAGLTRLIFNINGSSPLRHDGLYGTPGSFGATDRAMRWARDAGLAVEVNTLVTRRNMTDLEAIADLIRVFEITAWNIYFLVPIAGSRNIEVITAEEAERVFAMVAGIAANAEFHVGTFEAPHYQRYLLQQGASGTASWSDFSGYVSNSTTIDDTVFITAEGDVRPSEFLPMNAGNVRYRSLSSIYRASDLFVAFRDRSNLKGKCARCEYRDVCGGSRARAWAVTGDVFASDPLCAHQPRAMEASA